MGDGEEMGARGQVRGGASPGQGLTGGLMEQFLTSSPLRSTGLGWPQAPKAKKAKGRGRELGSLGDQLASREHRYLVPQIALPTHPHPPASVL